MNNTQSRKIWKCAVVSNDQAFTLVEALIALLAFTTIICFIEPIFRITLTDQKEAEQLRQMEWAVFSSQLKKEFRLSSRAEVISNRLILTKESETVQYEKSGSNLRRRVNSTGNEIILQNVASWTITLLPNAAKITVIDIKGREYSVVAYALVNWSSSP